MIDEGLIHYLFLASDIQTDATSRNQSTGNFARQTLHIQHVNTSHKGSENCFSTLQMAFSLVYKAHKKVFSHKTPQATSNRLHTSTAYNSINSLIRSPLYFPTHISYPRTLAFSFVHHLLPLRDDTSPHYPRGPGIFLLNKGDSMEVHHIRK